MTEHERLQRLEAFARDHWLKASQLAGPIREYWCIACDSEPQTSPERIVHREDCVVLTLSVPLPPPNNERRVLTIEELIDSPAWPSSRTPGPLVMGIDMFTGLPLPPPPPVSGDGV